jgi:hypothetical protein
MGHWAKPGAGTASFISFLESYFIFLNQEGKTRLEVKTWPGCYDLELM